MSQYYAFKVDAIVTDSMLSRDVKIEKLRALEAEANDLQRAASGGSANNSGDTNDDLEHIRLALAQLEG